MSRRDGPVKLELGLQDIGAVVVASSRDKDPGRSVGKRKQAYRPYFYKRVVYPVTEVRAYSDTPGNSRVAATGLPAE